MMEKRITVLAVSYDENVIICTAPFGASFFPGDTVEIEGLQDFGIVLIEDTMVYGGDDFELLDDHCLIRKVLKRVDFKELDWSGYKEEGGDDLSING